PALGFPTRESADHRLFSASPRLIAAVHALHRLLVPRHPPCALPILTVITRSARKGRTRGDTRSRPSKRGASLAWLCSFQGPRGRRALGDSEGGLSKLNSMAARARRATQARSTFGYRLELHAREMRAWHEAGAP